MIASSVSWWQRPASTGNWRLALLTLPHASEEAYRALGYENRVEAITRARARVREREQRILAGNEIFPDAGPKAEKQASLLAHRV